MLEAMIGFVFGVGVGVIVAVVFPVAFWVNRFLARRMGPSEMSIDSERILLGPEDHLIWEWVDEADSDEAADVYHHS